MTVQMPLNNSSKTQAAPYLLNSSVAVCTCVRVGICVTSSFSKRLTGVLKKITDVG